MATQNFLQKWICWVLPGDEGVVLLKSHKRNRDLTVAAFDSNIDNIFDRPRNARPRPEYSVRFDCHLTSAAI